MDRKFDFVIFGATGFAGRHVTATLAAAAGGRKWAVGGRSDRKLAEVLEKVADETGHDVSQIPRLCCDVANYDSLLKMTSLTKIVINCVGPYRFFGEPVVKACVENGTSYVDICGEPIFLEKIALLFDDAAKISGSHVISACGFDCIPCDMGKRFAIDNFDGTLDSVEIYHQVSAPNGVTINFGTLHSAIYGVAFQSELQTIRQLAKEKHEIRLPKISHKLKQKLFFYNADLKAWCLPFLGADKSVAYRSTQFDYESKNERPVQTQVYMAFSHWIKCVLLILWGLLFAGLCRFRCGRYLLEKYPEYLTFGMFTKEGPSKIQLETNSFKTYVFGKGWARKKLNMDENPAEKPQDTITCLIEGGEPGYIATSAMLVAAAITLLEEKENIPGKGGVLTPAAAFADTKLIDRLREFGVKFTKINNY